jgi:xanthine dehydrogenase small subunit
MRRSISFLLGDEPRTLDAIDPTMTVLEYLRRREQRCGSKEGCAEGDCGACTVVLGEDDGERLRYRAVNACIQFLPTLDGKQLLTVEDLCARDGTLHPVQRALVDSNASQCGFCTPGFVMSLFALDHAGGRPQRAEIDVALAGNLCRCTGYGPIIAAARQIAEEAGSDRFAQTEAETVRKLRALPNGSVALDYDGRRYFAPTSSDELAELLARHPGAVLLGGGTDVGLWVTKQQRRLETLIYLGRVAELNAVVVRDGRIEIGAGVTYDAAHSVIARHYPDFGELIRRFASQQIRNLATIGGNIANGSPIGDGPPALIALGASLVLRCGDARRELPLEDFFIAYGKQDRRPDEFVETIRLPLPQLGHEFRCYKISKRFDQDITAVLGAFDIEVAGGRVKAARICFGGMAATPKRAEASEAALLGGSWDEAAIARAQAAIARDFAPIDDLRASKAYRLRVAQNLLYKFFLECSEPAVETRLVGPGAIEVPAHG